ncbi:Histone deacetylase 10 [Camelus dromedarius]|uniref:Histone deacetylase 10 n=1 Tax=Camelus dromedarius TaxID=9838 RepID=A0A5N4DGN9_CAMDR|nr:Histone deacetylase 10 [Camelus dromedarius]
MGTALVYHEDMTAARLLWEDPECEIECPQRLTAALEGLQQRGLEQRCLRLVAREASEAELGLVHSPEYVALLRGTQALGTQELQALSGQYDAVYFHPRTFHCARLAVGAALQLVDAVMTGAVRNGLALVRPPGHHSQRAAANGFCVFNSVAIAARHAKQKHGLHRVLIVDWDVHHGQGTQYIFEDDPSVLYFSWHRYEHRRFWPYLRESDADAVGQGQGLGFTVNLPWNQVLAPHPRPPPRAPHPAHIPLPERSPGHRARITPGVGMGNADYMAAFLHVLLPLAFEGQMQATPECFAHLTQLLQVLADGRVCAVLEGGYHLESLSQSVCMMVQALLGDPAPPLSGPMVPHGSALESIQSVRAAQAPYWMSLQQQGAAPVLSPSTCSPEGKPSPLLPWGPEFKAAATQTMAALSSLLDKLCLNPTPPVRTAVALTAPDAALVLPPGVLCQERSALPEEMQAWARPHKALAQDKALTALGKVLYLLDRLLDGQVSSGIAATPAPATAATLDVAIRCGLSHGAQRLLCVAVGQLDRPPDLTDDGYDSWVICMSRSAYGWADISPWIPRGDRVGSVSHTCSLSLGRRNLWLNIGGKEAAAPSTFHVCVPLPGVSGGVMRARPLALNCPSWGNCGCICPSEIGSFQPDLVLVALGPAHGLRDPQAALLTALLRGPAGGRVLALIDEESTPQLVGVLARVLHGEAPPSLGPFSMASPEDMQALMRLRGPLEPQWKMLQVAGEAGVGVVRLRVSA